MNSALNLEQQLALSKLTRSIANQAVIALSEEAEKRRSFLKAGVAGALGGMGLLSHTSAQAADLLPIYQKNGKWVFSQTPSARELMAQALSVAFASTKAEFVELQKTLNPAVTAPEFNGMWAALSVRFTVPEINRLIGLSTSRASMDASYVLADVVCFTVIHLYGAWLSVGVERYVRGLVRARVTREGGNEFAVHTVGAVAAIAVLVAFSQGIAGGISQALIAANKSGTATKDELRRKLLLFTPTAVDVQKEILGPGAAAINATSGGFHFDYYPSDGKAYLAISGRTAAGNLFFSQFVFNQKALQLLSTPIQAAEWARNESIVVELYKPHPAGGGVKGDRIWTLKRSVRFFQHFCPWK